LKSTKCELVTIPLFIKPVIIYIYIHIIITIIIIYITMSSV